MAGKFRRRRSVEMESIDARVGGRVRLRRTLLGLSQGTLGQKLGLTFQQVQKYEQGANRIGASRLYALSRILEVPISYFFDDLEYEIRAPAETEDGELAAGDSRKEAVGSDPLMRRETLELVRAYYRIRNAQTRRRLVELINDVGQIGAAGEQG
jgi:transcriptional regulator with XRE-family HTH domain